MTRAVPRLKDRRQVHLMKPSELGDDGPAEVALAAGKRRTAWKILLLHKGFDANWDSKCCKAPASWIESLTLPDALSN